jgi:hypothetical protein
MGRKVYREVYVEGKLYKPGSEMDDEVAEKVRSKRVFEKDEDTVVPKATQGHRVEAATGGDEPAKPGWSSKPRVPKSMVSDTEEKPEKKGQPSAQTAERSVQGAHGGAADAGKRTGR